MLVYYNELTSSFTTQNFGDTGLQKYFNCPVRGGGVVKEISEIEPTKELWYGGIDATIFCYSITIGSKYCKLYNSTFNDIFTFITKKPLLAFIISYTDVIITKGIAKVDFK